MAGWREDHATRSSQAGFHSYGTSKAFSSWESANKEAGKSPCLVVPYELRVIQTIRFNLYCQFFPQVLLLYLPMRN